MKFRGAVLALFLVAFATGYVQLANSQDSPIRQREGIKSDHDVFFNNKINAIRNESEEMIMNSDISVPPTKIPPISANVGPLIRSLLERVWVTKYFGVTSEIYNFSSDAPLCNALPDSNPRQDDKSGVFLWRHECVPVTIKFLKADDKDLSGTAVVRMLDFAKSADVIGEVFEIIRADSLGIYEIQETKKDKIKNVIKEDLDAKSSKPIFVYMDRLRTYPVLEGRFFLKEALIGSPDVTNEPEDVRKYFSYRGKKYALSIQYNPKDYKKEGNIIEYSLALPTGFFGLGDERKK